MGASDSHGKRVLQAVIGSQILDEQRLHTLFCAVEEIVNGRPITPISDDPNDLGALTPLHLLRMDSDTFPIGDDRTLADTYRRRWKHVQYIADQFWKRWTKEYLPTLRQRHGSSRPHRDWQPGDVVLIADQSLPRSQWMLGRILEVIPSEDGVVRRVRVKTRNSVLTRPVSKLCWLEGVRNHESFELDFE